MRTARKVLFICTYIWFFYLFCRKKMAPGLIFKMLAGGQHHVWPPSTQAFSPNLQE